MQTQQSPYSVSRSPYSVIDKLTKIHEQNQGKQRKAQSSNHKMILLYEHRKSEHQTKMKQKENQIISKFDKGRRERLQQMKQKTEQLDKILHKFHKLEEDKMKNKIEAIENRKAHLHKSWHQNNNKEQVQQKPIAKCLSRSFNLKSFYSQNLASTSQLCQQILERSLEKQRKVEENRLLISENLNKTKQINFLKGLRKMKADEKEEEKHNIIMKKSILKFEQAEKRYEDLQSCQRKRSIQKRQKDAQNVEKAKNKRRSLEVEAHEKLKKVQQVLHQKSQKIYKNKQNLSTLALNEKVIKRLKQTSENNEKYKRHISLYNEKMSQNYKKDKEEWNFLTNIERLKETLIEKNIYQNNQLSLLK